MGRRAGMLAKDCAANNLVEFALVLPILVILALGLISTGQLLERYLNVVNLARNAGNMYSRNVDFEQPLNRDLLIRAATDMNMSVNSGDGVVFLSKVSLATFGANDGLPIVDERFVIGNAGAGVSRVGTPLTVDPVTGEVDDPENDPDAVVPSSLRTTFVDMINAGADRVFFAEVIHQPKNLYLPLGDAGLYTRVFF